MKIVINEEYQFKTITPAEGMKLSDWDKQDILHYSSCSQMAAPLNYDESVLYEITVEEDEKYRSEQKEAYEKEEAKRR